MKISLIVGAVTYVLAHGTYRVAGNHIGPSSLKHSSRALAQVNQFLRGAYAVPVGRGNITGNISFGVVCDKSTVVDAQDYVVMYPLNTPRAGTVEFLIRAAEAGTVICWRAPCTVDMDMSHTGALVSISYTIVAGQFTAYVAPEE